MFGGYRHRARLGRPLVVAAVLMALGVLVGAEAPWLGLALAPVSCLPFRSVGLFFGVGLLLVQLRSAPASDFDRQVASAEGPVVLDGVVVGAPELGPSSEVLTLELVGVMTQPPGAVSPARGRVRVMLPRLRDETSGVFPSPCAAPGERVRVLVRARPSGPPLHDGEAAMRRVFDRRGIAGFARARAHTHCRRMGPAPPLGFELRMERARAALHLAIDRTLPGDAGAVVRAFATGDRSGIPRTLDAAFVDSGLSHLLAVSGLNLAIVSGLFVVVMAWVFRRIAWVSLGPGVARTAALSALPLVLLYTFLVGLSASAVRAAFMMGGLLLAATLRRRPDPASTLALAVVCMLSLDPWTLWDVSFQLSFAAVFALFYLYPPLRARLVPGLKQRPWWWRSPIEVTLASLAATMGTAPIVAYHFQRVSLVGLFANVPAAPLGSFVLVPLSLLGGGLSVVSETLGTPILQLAREAALLLILIAEGSRSLPLASFSLPAPSLLEAALAFVLFYAVALPARWRTKVALMTAGLLAALVGAGELARATSKEVVVSFLPVGQGDATLIELPGGVVWLIDVGPPGREGPSAAERVILPYLRKRRISAIDTVVLTHPHADHIGGLLALSEHVPVHRVLWNGDEREAAPELIQAIRARPNQVVDVCTPALRYGAAELRFLGPAPRDRAPPVVNDGSLVLMLRVGERRVLFTGDAEAAAESYLVRRHGEGLRADVLKAGHHGSRTSSTEGFLDAVQPAHVVLSLGRHNGFGFPHAEVLERLGARALEVYRTDVQGVVRLETDGERLELHSFVKPPMSQTVQAAANAR